MGPGHPGKGLGSLFLSFFIKTKNLGRMDVSMLSKSAICAAGSPLPESQWMRISSQHYGADYKTSSLLAFIDSATLRFYIKFHMLC